MSRDSPSLRGSAFPILQPYDNPCCISLLLLGSLSCSVVTSPAFGTDAPRANDPCVEDHYTTQYVGVV